MRKHQSNLNKSPNRLLHKIVVALVSYFKTQMLLMGLVLLVSWLLLAWLNVHFSLYLAILTATLSVVPILGITLAAIVAGIVATFDGSVFLPMFPPVLEGISILILYGVLNVLIDYFASPYLIGRTIHIHPLIVIGAVLLGTLAFGVLGAFFTIPVIIVLKTIQDHHAEG